MTHWRKPRATPPDYVPSFYTTPPSTEGCLNFNPDGPTPCWHPHCDCFEKPHWRYYDEFMTLKAPPPPSKHVKIVAVVLVLLSTLFAVHAVRERFAEPALSLSSYPSTR